MNAPRRWAAIPAQRSSAPLLQVKLRIVVALLLAAALAGPIAVVVSLASAGRPAPVVTGPNQLAVSFGAQVARDFIIGAGTGLPVAEGVDPSFGRPDPLVTVTVVSVELAGYTSATVDGLYVETYSYIVRQANGRIVRVDVPLTFTSEGPVLAATPAMLAASVFAQRNQTVEALDWDRVDGVSNSVPAATAAAISEWARAYAAGDGAALQRITGDQDTNARYVGIGGVEVIEVRTLNTFARGERYSVVRAWVLFSFAGVDGYRSATEFDLLILDPALPNPRVQAWGPPGSGPTLEPLQNNTNRT